MQTNISTRFDEDTIVRLDEAATMTAQPRSAIIKEAVARYLDYLSWYTEEVQKGLDDVSAGRTVSHAEMKEQIRGLGFNVD